MRENVFSNLTRGNVLKTHAGLKSGEIDKDYKFGKDYAYIECQLNDDCKTKLEAGQFAALFPSVTLEPKKCRLLCVVNSELATVGAVSYQSIIEQGDDHAIGISIKAERDYDLSELGWLCRFYCIYG